MCPAPKSEGAVTPRQNLWMSSWSGQRKLFYYVIIQRMGKFNAIRGFRETSSRTSMLEAGRVRLTEIVVA